MEWLFPSPRHKPSTRVAGTDSSPQVFPLLLLSQRGCGHSGKSVKVSRAKYLVQTREAQDAPTKYLTQSLF